MNSARDVINYVTTPEWDIRVRELTGGQGADVVVEVGGAGTIAQSIGGGSRSDLEDMNRVIAAHRLRPVIDRVFPFEEAPAAASYLARGGHFGKVVISH